MNGLLLSQHWGRWRARFAVRVNSAVDLTGLAGYAELAPADRYARAHGEDIEYLTRLCGTDPDSAFEARWLAVPGSRPALTLLGRVDRPGRQEAEHDGELALERLAGLPEHVQATKLTEDVESAFTPFEPHPRGIVEVRKQVATARPERPDAPVRFYLTVSPFRSAPQRWPGLLDRLAHSGPIMVSATVKPMRVPPEFATMLGDVAAQYARLAQPGEFRPGGLYARPVRLEPDPLAATAQHLYRDAASRYFGWVLRLRVTIASPEPIGEDLAQSVADVLGGVLERPAGQGDLALLRAGIGSLEMARWGGHPVWQSVPDTLHLLCELADHPEAASAFWLPAAAAGSLPGFPVTSPAPDRRAGPGVVFQDSEVTIHGDVIGGSQHNHD